MTTITITLILLLAVVASGIITRVLPILIPRPLVQIAFGALIGMAPQLRVTLNPEVFFLLFVPPLLFLDGWRIPNEELMKDRRVILQLALGLVIFTVIGIGYLVHWMVPAMPLAVAFALAAVVSPTDPIAITAMAGRVPIPKRLMRILAGESLLNDASGLVCLRFAIAAVLTGSFSLVDATVNFLWLVAGGIAVGFGVTWMIAHARDWIARRVGEEAGSQIIISLLIPFTAYLVAEQLQCSGILAAVTAGVTLSYVESSGQALPGTRMRRSSVWDMLRFAANGIVFVLLGEQLPAILSGAAQTVRITGHQQTVWLLVYVLAINIGVILLRFVWVWASLSLTMFKSRLSGAAIRRPNWRLVTATSLAGVRGAITLAGVLTIPLLLNDGTAFPARDLAITLAMGVIIVSLIVAGAGLPWLLKGVEMPDEPVHNAEENRARVAAAEAAIAEIERIQHELSADQQDVEEYLLAATMITDLYRARIEARSHQGTAATQARHSEAIERRLRVAGIRAERMIIFELLRAQKIGSETATKIVRELDLLETRHET